MKITPVILAGGSGTRLWPVSRSQYPKQFLNLLDAKKSLFQQTIERLETLEANPAVVVCNEEHRFVVAEQLRLLNYQHAKIVLEPVSKNTAPSVALAALDLSKHNEDALMLVFPADHHIADVECFLDCLRTAFKLAEDGFLVTLGVEPDRAETGYGYIQRGEQTGRHPAFRVEKFVEKPDKEKAQQYVQEGGFYWNSGIFIFKASTYLSELAKFAPQILSACTEAIGGAHRDLGFIRLDEQAFAACPADSIDYAVMENTELAAVVPLTAPWTDLGTWAALMEVSPKDLHGNVLVGDILLKSSATNYIYSPDTLTAAIGMENLIVINTADALLIAHKDHAQDVKTIVSRLVEQNRVEHQVHKKVFRPWGHYEGIAQGERYLVKRITVNPGASLSTQLHHHRAEHWVVVTGTAKVTNGDKSYFLTENQSTFIPIGQTHKLENPGDIPLELIEVQSGSYLSEEDIVRLEDDYGRV